MEAPTAPRRVNPPHWLLLFLGIEAALNRWLPGPRIIPAEVRLAGWVLAALGIGLVLWAARGFSRADTGIVPFSPSTNLLVAGPYRFSRNPIYLGMVIFLIGIALVMGAATAFLAPVGFGIVIHYRFVKPEEAHMERTFGQGYLDFKSRVRRWI
jgi:protein-S-isoprenylcysteine O-methyltransferase Ste14